MKFFGFGKKEQPKQSKPVAYQPSGPGNFKPVVSNVVNPFLRFDGLYVSGNLTNVRDESAYESVTLTRLSDGQEITGRVSTGKGEDHSYPVLLFRESGEVYGLTCSELTIDDLPDFFENFPAEDEYTESGMYIINSSRPEYIEFTLSNVGGSVSYKGVAEQNKLTLESHSHINDYEETVVYKFYPV